MEGNTAIIACSMLRDELTAAMEKNGQDAEIIWMEKALHEYPDRLRSVLQSKIDENQDKDFLLLVFCLCGNAMVGLAGGKATLVIPKFDDCIHMLLAHESDKKPETQADSLYYTREWLSSERFILADYAAYIQKYGQKKADFIIRTMLANYRGLKLIDTGCYPVLECMDQAKEAAEKLKLEFSVVAGTNRILEGLHCFQGSGEYIVIPPGEAVTSAHFGY